MMKVLAVCGLFALTKAQDAAADMAGTTGCACAAQPPVSGFVIPAGETGEGLLRARPDGESVIPYPVSYGTLCGTRDVAAEPYCADASGDPLVDDPHSHVVAEQCSGGILADARCPCVNWADDLASRAQFENDEGTSFVVPLGDSATTTGVDEGQDYVYALCYGSSVCATHDTTHAPYSVDANGAPLADAPSWCQAGWCWVDPNNWVDPTNYQLSEDDGTAIRAVASSYFHRDGQPASSYYSYETCQHDNTFSYTELGAHSCNDEVGSNALSESAP